MPNPIKAASNYAHLLAFGAKKGKKAEDDDDKDMKKADSGEDDDKDDKKKDDDKDTKKSKKSAKEENDDDHKEEDEPDEDDNGGEDDDDDKKDKKKDSKKGKSASSVEDLIKAAREDERARCAQIFSSSAAAGRVQQACHVAFHSDMSAKSAITFLAGSPVSDQSQTLENRMRQVKNPEVTDSAPSATATGGKPGLSAIAQSMIAAYDAATGGLPQK